MTRLLTILCLVGALALPLRGQHAPTSRRLLAGTAVGAAGPPATQRDYLIPTKGPSYGDTSNSASYATASWTARSNSMIVATVAASGTAGSITANPPGTGMGLTWTLQKQMNCDTLETPTRTLCVYTAMTGSTNATGIFKSDFSPNTMSGACVHMWEIWNASNALVQVVAAASNSTANPRLAFTACALPGTNAFFMAIADSVNSGVDNVPDAQMKWSEIWETNYTTPASGLATYYCLAAPPSVIGVTNTATSRNWAMILLEIQPNIVLQPVPPLVVDLFVNFEDSTDGTLVTTTIASNGTPKMNGGNWTTLSNLTTVTVSTAQTKKLLNSVSVLGTTYDDSTATRAWRIKNIQNREHFRYNLAATQTNISWGHYWRFDPGTTNWGADFNNYNYTTINCVGGEEVVLLVVNATPMEIRTETGIETGGSSETSFPNPATNKWYWITGTFDKSRLIGRIMVFDTTTTPWTQAGYSDAITTSDDATLLALGRWDQHGSSKDDVYNYMDGFIAKWGDIQSMAGGGFPLMPLDR